MVTTTRPMTAEELLDMPDDGFRYELVRGELRKMPLAGHVHGKHAASIGVSLAVHVKANGLGVVYASGTGFKLASNPDHVRAPDAAFVRRERAEAVGDATGYFPGVPDLVIEVVSPSDRYAEVDEKVADWLDAGAQAGVVVNPRGRVVRVHRSLTDVVVLTESDTLDVSDVVQGWQMPIREIFE